MCTYYCIVIFICTTAFLSLDKRASNVYVLFLFIILSIMLSLVSGTRLVGYDIVAYIDHFNKVNPIQLYSRCNLSMEIGYELLVSITKGISGSFHFFLLIFSSLSLFLSIILFYRWTTYPLVSFMLFCSFSYFTMIMGQMRQPIAVIIVYLVTIPLLLKNRNILATFTVLLCAIYFHKSLYLFTLIIGLSIFTFSLRTILLGFISAFIILFTVSTSVNDFIITLLPKDLFIAQTAQAYLSYKSYALQFSLGMIERIGCCTLIIYLIIKNNLTNHKLLRILSNIYILGSMLYVAFLGISAEFASRGT